MKEALQSIYEDLYNLYDGAADSPTKWMGHHLDTINKALALAEGKEI